MNNFSDILIVEDDIDILKSLESYLKKQNFLVLTATSGLEALNILKTKKTHLILLDILLPDIDGPEIAKNLQNDPHTENIPILFLSGIISNDQNSSHASEIHVEGKSYKALGKPFTFQDLLAEINRLLKN